MEPRYLLYARRSLFVVLTLLMILSLLTLTPIHVYAQDPYDDLVAQIQALKKQLAELLAAYNALDADGRAAMDAAISAGMRESMNQIYGSLSDSDQAYMDEQLRQTMGCSFTQLMQSMTSVPDFVDGVDALCDAIENMADGTESPATAQPPATEQPTEKPSASEISGYDPPEQSDAVSFSTEQPELKISIGWQLFSDPDMSDETALKKYNENVAARLDELTKKKAAAEKRKAELERVKDAKKLDVYIDRLEKDLKQAKADGMKAIKQFFECLITEVADLVLDVRFEKDMAKLGKKSKSYIVLDALRKGMDGVFVLYPALKTLKDKYDKGIDITPEEWGEAQLAIADITKVVNSYFNYKPLKAVCMGAKLVNKLGDVAGTQLEIYRDRKALKQLSDGKEYSDSTLQHKIDVENMRIQEYDRQIKQLKEQGGYIDPKYLNT